MNAMPLIDPRWLGSIPDRFPSLCQVQQLTPTQDAIGGQIKTWTALVGHEAIPCAIGARGSVPSRAGSETRSATQTEVRRVRYVNLQGYFPKVVSLMRAVVDDDVYNILAVEHDSLNTYTRLDCEIVTT